MIESIFRLMFDYGEPFTEKEINRFLGKEFRLGSARLKQILQEDSRFYKDDQSIWRCSPWGKFAEDKPIQECSFVITDIETTGPIRGKDRIIDLAAVKVVNGEIVDRFEKLVNPEIHIPSVIEKLTGIEKSMVEDQPEIPDVLPDFLEFLGEGVFVAHNSPFDFSFLNHESGRLGLRPMTQNVEICTLKIANKVLPQLRNRGLNGLAKHFGFDIEQRHRAMSDVLATKFFLDHFMENLEQAKIESLHQLLDFQRVKISKREYRKKLKKIRKNAFKRSYQLNGKKQSI